MQTQISSISEQFKVDIAHFESQKGDWTSQIKQLEAEIEALSLQPPDQLWMYHLIPKF